METSRPDFSLARRLRWLMLSRVVTITFLLVTTVVVQFRDVGGQADTAIPALYVLIGATYFLTFVYAVFLPRWVPENIQAYLQILGDILIFTVVIYLTGGLESVFSFLYILAVINAGVLLRTRGALIAASVSAILYGGLLDLHYYNYISPYLTRFSYFDYYRATDILITILVNMGAFYLVAFLIGYLARQAEESRIKLAQRQTDLERLEDLSERIIQSMDSGLITLGPRGEILSFNAAAEQLTGFHYGQVRGSPFTLVFPGLDLPGDIEAGPSPGRVWSWTYQRPDGQRFFLDFHLLSLRDRSGASLGRLLVFQDKTQIRQMEEEIERIERLAVLGELAAGIAHEIRNPLASMSGSFQLLANDIECTGDQKRLMGIIRREMERLNHIVTDFLLFARPRPGDKVPIDLSRTIEDILNMFQHQANLNEKIRLIRNIIPGLWIIFDRQQLEQVMWNLLQNAVEAMSQGGRLTVTVSRPEKPASMAAVAVADTGPGISTQDLPRIWDPFFTTKIGGSGLGLAIVFRILEGGGGRIEVSSSPGQGTTFTLLLPLARRSD
ncbi:MAG: ATP-binding protein [Thermodesulfobacteriota bacterium]